MAYNTKNVITDLSGLKPAPQYFNTTADAYEVVQGAFGATRAMLYDVNGNPLFTSTNPGLVQLTGSYVEYTVVASDLIAIGTTKYYPVDLLTALGGAGVTKWGIAISTGTGSASKATVTAYSSPKNLIVTTDPNAFSQSEIVMTAQAIVALYPIQKQISFVSPNLIIAVNSNGTADLTGVKIVVWGMKGV